MNKIRIAKFLADSGACSRRQAESFIQNGRVAINGKVIDSPVNFISESDKITIDGKLIQKRNETILIAFNKPINVITSRSDSNGRKTIYDILPLEYKNLKYIGRLDYKTEGLLLLTNDGELARLMTLPKTGLIRIYHAKVHGKINESILDKARLGIKIDGIQYAPMKIKVLRTMGTNSELELLLTEGKNNEIRKVMAELGFQVASLSRISYGKIKLGNLKSGKTFELDKKTIDEIKKICEYKNI